jgi:hypothetical protein
VTYRSPSPERSAEAIAQRIAGISSEIDELDAGLGAWAKVIADGASAPPEVLAIVARKEHLLAELRALASTAESEHEPGALKRLFRRLRSR